MPLADRLRPVRLEDFVGQIHLVGPQGALRHHLDAGVLPSMIFWGPPGCGKTTLARLLAKHVGANYYELSAVSAGKADIRQVLSHASENPGNTILFLDEIHRFNKAQQDFLLPYVETGELTLIGATTENPSFEVISALLSRTRVYVLEPLGDDEMAEIIQRALGLVSLTITQEAKASLITYAGGDARIVLTILDQLSIPGSSEEIDNAQLTRVVQSKQLRFDKDGEEHYNTISAFIKSMRASDPDAALYYLARMVEAGEDPKFIARRMVVFASEDIGMAQPTALVVANEVFRSVEIIGYPECAINLAHGVVYLATAKKDRRAYDGLRQAQADVQHYGNLPIPMNLRNAPTKLMKDIGYGKGYEKYTKESLLPEKLKNKKYFKENHEHQ